MGPCFGPSMASLSHARYPVLMYSKKIAADEVSSQPVLRKPSTHYPPVSQIPMVTLSTQNAVNPCKKSEATQCFRGGMRELQRRPRASSSGRWRFRQPARRTWSPMGLIPLWSRYCRLVSQWWEWRLRWAGQLGQLCRCWTWSRRECRFRCMCFQPRHARSWRK